MPIAFLVSWTFKAISLEFIKTKKNAYLLSINKHCYWNVKQRKGNAISLDAYSGTKQPQEGYDIGMVLKDDQLARFTKMNLTFQKILELDFFRVSTLEFTPNRVVHTTQM